jgi:NADPH-dependent 2,4-dienoyl-CoA reductase/sulfur reductase-like enzyme
LAAAAAAEQAGAHAVLIEREKRLGGILKQCIHDGFGLIRFGEKLTGPEYSHRYIEALRKTGAEVRVLTFASRIERTGGGFRLTLVHGGGLDTLTVRALILSTGCRERTARQAAIHGTHPAGVLTAGTAQYYTNILGQLPARRCVILGSGDIGLIMARRLTLEGAEVLGVYEAKSTPSGLPRNIAQCLEDFDIPLYMNRTVSRVFGRSRLEGVEIAATDSGMRPVPGTEERIACDGLILSVGLIPENEIAESLGVPLHPATGGPVCDQRRMTAVPGIFSCGNALLVNDLVDYVSESGETAGRAAAMWALEDGNTTSWPDSGNYAEFKGDGHFLCLAPQRLDITGTEEDVTLFFRARDERERTLVKIYAGETEVFSKRYDRLKPPEMERITLRLKDTRIRAGDTIRLTMREV